MPSKPLKAIKPMFLRDKWRILKGDMVEITAGKDKGHQGKVLKVIRDDRFPRVIVQGANIIKKSITAMGNQPGFVVSLEAPLHYSNVQLLDPVTAKPVRTSFAYTEDGTKVRVTKGRNASGALVSVPQWWRERGVATPRSAGPLDTPPEEAQRATYDPSEDFPLKLPRYASDVRREREAAEAVAEAVAVLGASAPSAKGAASGGAPSSRRGFATFAASGLAAGGSCLARAVAGGNAALLAARARGVLPVATLPSTSTAAAACQSGRQLSSAAAGQPQQCQLALKLQ